MAKISTTKAPKSEKVTQAKPDKQQKKQLKHEANLKQKIELTQKDLQKAERKVLKAKTDVDTLTAQLQELNEKLTHSHKSSKKQEEKSHTETAEQTAPTNLVPEESSVSESTDSTDNSQPATGDSYEDSPAIEEMHQASLPPTEGRNDINDSQDSSSTDGTTEEKQISSSEQPEVEAESKAEEKSEADSEEPEHAEEQHTPARRNSRRRATTHES